MDVIACSPLPCPQQKRHLLVTPSDRPKRTRRTTMLTWLMWTSAAPTVLDGLLAYQSTGSPIPALVAMAAPLLRARLHAREDSHA
jgi:hypothetical protein